MPREYEIEWCEEATFTARVIAEDADEARDLWESQDYDIAIQEGVEEIDRRSVIIRVKDAHGDWVDV